MIETWAIGWCFSRDYTDEHKETTDLGMGIDPPPPKHTLEDDTRHTYDCKGERPRKETTRDDEFMLPSS